MLDMISIFLNLFRLVLCPIMWSIFENVPCAFEKNVYFASLGWKALCISVNFIWSRTVFNAEISLLTFCLEDLSIFDSGMLKSPTIILLLSISFLKSSKLFFMYLDAPTLGTYIFTMFMSSWWILHLSIMKWPSGSPFMVLFLKSILSDMSIATLPFFSFPFPWNVCFQLFTVSLYRSFVLRWVSCRQHMCGSCLCLPWLCLLGASELTISNHGNEPSLPLPTLSQQGDWTFPDLNPCQ